jgi:hypothetical protein
MSNTIKWAEQELEFAGYRADDTEDGPNKWLREGTLELLRVFSEQGHSGMSAPFAIKLFADLANHKPLTPLTGNDDEWDEVGTGVFQNKRASNVFKEGGEAYWMDGIVFWEWFTSEETGERFKSYFTSRDSRVPVTFPFTMPDEPEYRERITP